MFIFLGKQSVRLPWVYPQGLFFYSVFDFFGRENIIYSTQDGIIAATDDRDRGIATLPSGRHRDSLFNKHTKRILDELLQNSNIGSTVWSFSKGPLQTGVGVCRYLCLGPKCKRNGKGTYDLTDQRLNKEQQKEILRIISQSEYVLSASVPHDYIWCHKDMLKELGVPMFKGKNSSGKLDTTAIFPTIAYGKNVYLPVHTDNDSFLSIVSVCDSSPGERSEVLAYFCFPGELLGIIGLLDKYFLLLLITF